MLEADPAPEKETGESRASLAVTVLWTLTGLATAIMEVGVLASGLIILWQKPIDEEKVFYDRMFGLLYVASLAAGLLLLGLIPAVYRFRDTPPPIEITWLAIFLGGLPIVTGLAFFLIG